MRKSVQQWECPSRLHLTVWFIILVDIFYGIMLLIVEQYGSSIKTWRILCMKTEYVVRHGLRNKVFSGITTETEFEVMTWDRVNWKLSNTNEDLHTYN